MVCVWVCAELKLLPTDRGVPSLPAVVTVSEKPAEAVTVFERVAPTITIISPSVRVWDRFHSRKVAYKYRNKNYSGNEQ